MSLIAELKRRNVIRVGAAYVVASWLVIQVVETIFPVYGLSDAAIRFAITALAVGFIPAVIFAWVFELTPEGLKRGQDVDHSASKSTETGKKLDKAIIVVLVLAVGYFAFDKFILSGSREQAIAEAAREEGRAESIIEAFGENSIAVLPFVDMSSDKDQEYMSDGIAEELLNLLTKVPKLRVVSRSSAFFFKDKDIDIPTVAQKLNVAYILEGSVRTAGDQLRITAQLIDATSDSHVWSETYDRQLENVFDIQDEIANAVVDELKVQFLGGDLQSIRFDEEAYRLVLQARYLWYRRAPGDEEQALALYEHALEIDPTSAPAWTGLSVALAAHALDGRIDSEQGFARAHEAAEKALELGPNLADAHIRMAQANLRAKLYDEAVENMRIAYELDPDSPLVLAVLADQKLREYRVQEALDLYKRAQEVDPMSALWFENTFRPLLLVQRFDEAVRAAREAYERHADANQLNKNLGDIHLLRKEFDQALEYYNLVPMNAVVWPPNSHLVGLAATHFGAGNKAESAAMVERIKAMQGPFTAWELMLVAAHRQDFDEAFERLHKFQHLQAPGVRKEPMLMILHDDPRWRPFVASLPDPFPPQ